MSGPPLTPLYESVRVKEGEVWKAQSLEVTHDVILKLMGDEWDTFKAAINAFNKQIDQKYNVSFFDEWETKLTGWQTDNLEIWIQKLATNLNDAMMDFISSKRNRYNSEVGRLQNNLDKSLTIANLDTLAFTRWNKDRKSVV